MLTPHTSIYSAEAPLPRPPPFIPCPNLVNMSRHKRGDDLSPGDRRPIRIWSEERTWDYSMSAGFVVGHMQPVF